RQATHIKTTLKPWKVAGPLDRTVAFLGRKLVEVGVLQQATQWRPIIALQKENLAKIGGAITQIDRGATSLGITDKADPRADVLRHVLDLYAQAAAVSHLKQTCNQLIARAAEAQAALTVQS